MLNFLLLLLTLTLPTTAQETDETRREWDEFRFTEYDDEVAAGLRQVQQLLDGRESLIQSYERTDQNMIATECAIEQLHQERIHTSKAALSYYEAAVNFTFPEPSYGDIDEFSDGDSIEDFDAMLWSLEEEPEPPLPPLFRIRSLSETSDRLAVEIENLGDPIDALVSVADTSSAIISKPYHVALSNWNDPRHLSFRLLKKSEKFDFNAIPGYEPIDSGFN